jgi:hypothetical protein
VRDSWRSRGGVALAVAVVLPLSACVSPAVDANGYHGKVTQSAKKMTGIIGAALLAVRLDLDHKMLRTITDNVVSDAETDANSVLTALDSVQPPDAASVVLRGRADDILQNAAGELADLRIAVRRGDQAGMAATVDALGTSLGDVAHLQDVR